MSPTAVDASAVRRSVALCRFVWNATIKSWASGGYSSPRPSRQREWGESPSAVRVAGQKSHDRQPVGEHSGKRTMLRSTRNDESPLPVSLDADMHPKFIKLTPVAGFTLNAMAAPD